jgi:hypothetical protein
MRRLAVAAGSLLLAGCVAGVQVAAEPPGPVLVLDITNASDRELAITHEFTANTFGGASGTSISACRQEAMDLGSVNGEYHVAIDGEVVHEGTVPDGVGADRFLVVRIRVDPDGEIEALPAAVLGQGGQVSRALPGCGGE